MHADFIKYKQYRTESYGTELSEFRYDFALKFYSLLERYTEELEKIFKIISS